MKAFFLLSLLAALISAAHATAPTTFRYKLCNIPESLNQSSVRVNVQTVLTTLQNHSSLSIYNTTSSGTGSEEVFGMFQCRGDLSLHDCSDCMSQNVRVDLPRECPSEIGARIWLDGCFLRYENYMFLTADFHLIWSVANPDNNTDEMFRQNRNSVLETVVNAAPANGGYNASYAGTNDSNRVYGLSQCLGFLSASDCTECLSNTLPQIKQLMANNKGGILAFGSCYSRYEVYDFFNEPQTLNSPPPSSPPASNQGGENGEKTPVLIKAVVGSSLALVVVVLSTLTGIWLRRKSRFRRRGQEPVEQATLAMQTGFQKGPRLFSFEELKRATRNFHLDNQLGEGGFGPVYKGTIEDGEDVAIKKLSSGSRQGERQFLNEVTLITTVQHRNLIKLLGCCVQGTERLLVYEYLPKKSLNRFLFEPGEDAVTLDWKTRREIIRGIAKGLAYLHEESQVRIVHRDIKASNILLDNELNPKIADFGLARLFQGDVTHVSTGLAGTLGYLAPEYAMHGQLTEKADVFSFGLVTLETVTGRKNTDPQLPPERQHLLEWVWRMYVEQRPLEVVDPRLVGHFFVEEVIRVVHVALLCVQAQPGLRPTMSKVVLLLASQLEILEIPTKPAYLEMSYVPPTSFMPASSSQLRFETPLLQMSQNNASMSSVEPR